MSEYHKIQTVFLRDPATNHKTLLERQWAKPEFAYLADCLWRCEEKIDGTNVRVLWDGSRVRFAGKTDNAQMPPFLLAKLESLFTEDTMRAAFPDIPPLAEGQGRTPAVVLYGEGYGARIQKGGGRYIADGVSFILFDAFCGLWLERESVRDIAGKLDVETPREIDRMTLPEAVDVVRGGFKSYAACDATLDAEGLIMRPEVELLNRRGERVITKIKAKDFAPESPR
jgi:hypothetical protein